MDRHRPARFDGWPFTRQVVPWSFRGPFALATLRYSSVPEKSLIPQEKK